ncbi:MAG: hypothetical protein WBN70_18985 [Polyangiales bacterium]
MKHPMIRVADNFWNIRGSFKTAGVLEVGTQASLVKRANGKFVFLDAYTLDDSVAREVRGLTNGGADVEAILNLHPFHTIHVRRMHEQFPDAKLYGTARHLSRFPELPWQQELTESAELHAMFGEDFDFSVPRGVDFISENENIHFSSVLAFHRASKTIHVDDTLIYLRLPKLARVFGFDDLTMFHPTLAKALERRAGASADFRQWAEGLAERWRSAQNLCAAHSGALTAERNQGASIHARILQALAKVARTLKAHEQKYG